MAIGARRGRVAGLGIVGALDVAGTVCWWFGLAPLPLLLAGYVATWGALLRHLPPRIAAAAAVAPPLVVHLALLLALPPLVGGPLRPEVALGVLLLPSLAALAWTPAWEPPQLRTLTAAGLGGSLVTLAVLAAARTDRFAAYAWVASGDARLHQLFTRQVIDEGGLAEETLTFQPQFSEGLVALLAATSGRATLDPVAAFERDLAAMAAANLFLIVAWCALMVVAVVATTRDTPPWGVSAAASLLPLTGLGLGVILADGFTPILLLLVVAIPTFAVLAWALTEPDLGRPTTLAVANTAAALPVLAFTWTPVFGIAAVACLPTWVAALRTSPSPERRLRLLVTGLGGATGSAYCLFMLTKADRFITIPGSIAAPTALTAVAVVLVVAATTLSAGTALPRRHIAPWAVGTVTSLAVVVYAVAVQPPGLPWNYFPAKVAWVWILLSLPLVLTALVHPRAAGTRHAQTIGALAVLALAAGVARVASPVVPMDLQWLGATDRPLGSIGNWSRPSADSLRLAADLGDRRTRYVVFDVDPAEDRLTNFWLAVHHPPSGPFTDDEFVMWSYRPAGAVEDLCDLLDLQPDRVVVTAGHTSADAIRRACGPGTRIELTATR